MRMLLYELFIKKTNVIWLQFFRYIFVGGISATINIGTLYIFTDFFHIYYLFSNVIGFLLGLMINYLLSKYLIFTSKISLNKTIEILTYCFVGVVGLALDTFFMWIGTSKIGIYYIITKVISTALVFIWNFLGRKSIYIIFKDKRGVIDEKN